MDGLFDIRHAALDLGAKRRSAAAEVRTALLLTLSVTVVVIAALLALDAFGLAPVPPVEFPGLQDMGWQNGGAA